VLHCVGTQLYSLQYNTNKLISNLIQQLTEIQLPQINMKKSLLQIFSIILSWISYLHLI